ncbi:polysaccharide pyruvyl transferase family protein [bacterium]|nr:polysaccharide pyruvyl transferase family protein [bacterium]
MWPMRFVQRAKRYWELGNPLRKRIAYIGWQGHENLGDEMLYEAHKRLFPDYHVLPFVSLSKKRRDLHRRIARRDVFQAGCLGGGTLINRAKGYEYKLARLLAECSPVFCLGTGVANPEFWEGRDGWGADLRAWIGLLKQCRFVGVRGPMSADLLKQAGLQDVEVVGDSALVLARDSYKTNGETKTLGINIGTSRGNVWGSEEDMLQKMAQISIKALADGWHILYLCVWPIDYDITVRLAELTGITDPKIHMITNDTEQALDLCERCTVFIGMKLHAVVCAICAGVPSIMIEYRPKCRDFMASLDMEEFNVRSDSLNPAELMDMIQLIRSKRTSIQEKMQERVLHYKQLLVRRAKSISDMIKDEH